MARVYHWLRLGNVSIGISELCYSEFLVLELVVQSTNPLLNVKEDCWNIMLLSAKSHEQNYMQKGKVVSVSRLKVAERQLNE